MSWCLGTGCQLGMWAAVAAAAAILYLLPVCSPAVIRLL